MQEIVSYCSEPDISKLLWFFSFHLQKSALSVRKLESEKARVQREMEPILTKKPLGPSASTLPQKLCTANNKFDEINSLIALYDKK